MSPLFPPLPTLSQSRSSHLMIAPSILNCCYSHSSNKIHVDQGVFFIFCRQRERREGERERDEIEGYTEMTGERRGQGIVRDREKEGEIHIEREGAR